MRVWARPAPPNFQGTRIPPTLPSPASSSLGSLPSLSAASPSATAAWSATPLKGDPRAGLIPLQTSPPCIRNRDHAQLRLDTVIGRRTRHSMAGPAGTARARGGGGAAPGLLKRRLSCCITARPSGRTPSGPASKRASWAASLRYKASRSTAAADGPSFSLPWGTRVLADSFCDLGPHLSTRRMEFHSFIYSTNIALSLQRARRWQYGEGPQHSKIRALGPDGHPYFEENLQTCFPCQKIGCHRMVAKMQTDPQSRGRREERTGGEDSEEGGGFGVGGF